MHAVLLIVAREGCDMCMEQLNIRDQVWSALENQMFYVKVELRAYWMMIILVGFKSLLELIQVGNPGYKGWRALVFVHGLNIAGIGL